MGVRQVQNDSGFWVGWRGFLDVAGVERFTGRQPL
ncbi:MAG: hypothetical protein RI897_3089 [Verrucomicrobiota bacterium]